MQMGSRFKQGMFDAYTQSLILDWAKPGRRGGGGGSSLQQTHTSHFVKQSSFDAICLASASDDQITHQNRHQISLSWFLIYCK